MQRLKNGKRRQVPHRKRAKFGGSALIVSVISWIGSWLIGPKGRIDIVRRT